MVEDRAATSPHHGVEEHPMTPPGPAGHEPSTDARPAAATDPVFAPFADPQSYLNLVYLLLAFPLGLFYFVFLTTGLSLGLGLVVLFIGLPLLLVVLFIAQGFASFERALARGLLGVAIVGPPPAVPIEGGLFRRLAAFLGRSETWLGLLYLFLKFILGTFAFALLISLFGASLGMIAAPFVYEQSWYGFDIPGWFTVDSLGKAAAVAMFGAILGVASFHFMNGLAWLYGRLARGLLAYQGPSAS
jgi:hypothetical protein